MTCARQETDDAEEFESLAQYLERTDPIIAPLIRTIRFQRVYERTRRTVAVIARKPRARRGRRRKR